MAKAARILLVDDLAEIRESTTLVLESAGYTVVGAADDVEALAQLVGDLAFDLMVTDIVLGKHANGFELAQEAVRLRPDLKVLYSTGYAGNLEDLYAAVPGSRMLRKPYRAHELLREIDLLLDSPAPVIAVPDQDAVLDQRPRKPKAKPAILVVEDDARSSAIAIDLFVGLGHDVFNAGTAEEALTLLVKHPEIAVLFSDVRLPGMSGIELAEEVRAHRPDIRIVLTSAYMAVTPVLGTRFIPKPWSTSDFTLVAGLITRH